MTLRWKKNVELYLDRTPLIDQLYSSYQRCWDKRKTFSIWLFYFVTKALLSLVKNFEYCSLDETMCFVWWFTFGARFKIVKVKISNSRRSFILKFVDSQRDLKKKNLS